VLQVHHSKVEFAKGLTFTFPKSPCCNCGTSSGLQAIEQDTRQTTYLFGGGTEVTFRLPLPFCPSCVPTAKRRPKNFFHQILMFLVCFGLAFLALIVVGDVIFSIPALGEYVAGIAFGIALLVTGLMALTRKPKGKQTSYFQPVRIQKLKREFVSGTVTGIRFAFTNGDYARAFTRENQQSIKQKFVEVAAA